MLETRTSALLLTLALAAAAPAAAQPAAGTDQRISLDLVDAAARDVFASFGAMLQGEIDLDPAIGGELTLRLSDVSLRIVLDAMCDMLGCEWVAHPEGRSGPALRVWPTGLPEALSMPPGSLDTPITLSLAGAAPDSVFRSFAQILGAELELDWGERVTIEIRDQPLAEALDRVCAQLVCRWQFEEAEGRRLRVW